MRGVHPTSSKASTGTSASACSSARRYSTSPRRAAAQTERSMTTVYCTRLAARAGPPTSGGPVGEPRGCVTTAARAYITDFTQKMSLEPEGHAARQPRPEQAPRRERDRDARAAPRGAVDGGGTGPAPPTALTHSTRSVKQAHTRAHSPHSQVAPSQARVWGEPERSAQPRVSALPRVRASSPPLSTLEETSARRSPTRCLTRAYDTYRAAAHGGAGGASAALASRRPIHTGPRGRDLSPFA